MVKPELQGELNDKQSLVEKTEAFFPEHDMETLLLSERKVVEKEGLSSRREYRCPETILNTLLCQNTLDILISHIFRWNLR